MKTIQSLFSLPGLCAIAFFLGTGGFLFCSQSARAESLSGGVTVSSGVAVSTGEVPDQAQIVFDETLYDFGRIKQGERVTKNFGFVNNGKAELVIAQLKTTCGCTAAVASTGPYPPGERGVIQVNYDSRGKFGHVLKDIKVFSTGRDSPQTITIEGTVFADQHPTMTAADVLFSGSCADCHASPAKGKLGAALYDAVCYLCHDFPQTTGKKWIAPDRNALSKLSKSKLKRLITEGIHNSSMPGFGDHAGGPLSKEQVESLAEYLISVRQN